MRLRCLCPIKLRGDLVNASAKNERIAGESHYPLKKMVALAMDGITSMSVKPIRMISGLGFIIALLSFIGILWAVITNAMGNTISGWTSMICVVCFIGGIQLICLGVIGEYVGKTYMETKERPRYIISERTDGVKTDDTVTQEIPR